MNYKNFLSLLLLIAASSYTFEQTIHELISSQADLQVPTTALLPENLFPGNPEDDLGTLKEKFNDQKLAFIVDFHKVFAKESHSEALHRFAQNNVPTLFKKIEAVALLAGIAIPTACNSLRLALIKYNPDGTPTEKRKISENYFLFIKNWWSVKLYNYFIQYSTDLYSPNKELIDLLYRLKAAGHRIYLFSNGGYDTINTLEKDERFKQYFEGPDRLFSDTPAAGQNSNSINDMPQEEYSLAKPSPEAFEAALKKHGEQAKYVVFFDDSREKLPDYKNPKLKKRYPNFKNFWACSILYNDAQHYETEKTLKMLGLLPE